MALADLALLLANIVYGTSYVVTRVALADVPPATLALLRVLIAAAVLVPLSLRTRVRLSGREHARIVGMGVVGFAAAFALGHWGLAQSTATNAALLIVAEPLGLILLGPVVLREHLRRSEAFGAGLALIGATLVVVNGIPGLTHALLPRWRGDLLLVLSGLAYAAYSILGRPILKHRPALPVTALSALWGVPGLVPLVTQEWLDGQRAAFTGSAVAGVLYLGVVITALGYLVWNWALERVPAARAGIFVNLQPAVGALLGVLLLGDAVSGFTVAGGALIVLGLFLTMRHARE
ncbi:MAG: hypothetical protein DME08_01270 [Candidatus Rokuibacteriota bacterium]|nr:MAG: hypothetical protein DME08_01270 [Candidatus Rokubacteria bacterium]PYO02229.1 MAG: hypothetical protein DMD89_04530 [Candidatus Rokubacteria bacterium]